MHVTVGVYMNGQYKYNIVRDEDLENHIKYNKIFRFGRGGYLLMENASIKVIYPENK